MVKLSLVSKAPTWDTLNKLIKAFKSMNTTENLNFQGIIFGLLVAVYGLAVFFIAATEGFCYGLLASAPSFVLLTWHQYKEEMVKNEGQFGRPFIFKIGAIIVEFVFYLWLFSAG